MYHITSTLKPVVSLFDSKKATFKGVKPSIMSSMSMATVCSCNLRSADEGFGNLVSFCCQGDKPFVRTTNSRV